MKTSKKKEGAVPEKEKQEDKQEPKSELKENLLAIGIFLLLILIGVAVFTKGFGLFDKSDDTQRFYVSIGNDPFTGNPNASVLIVAFSDYECPFCGKAEQTISGILEKYNDKIVYVFKDFPLINIHDNAYNAALAAECAKEQDKYWEYHKILWEHNTQLEVEYLKGYAEQLGLNTEKFNDCLESQKYKKEVDHDINTGKSVGVTGTPVFFINGIKIVGAQPEQEFTKIIDSELKNN